MPLAEGRLSPPPLNRLALEETRQVAREACRNVPFEDAFVPTVDVAGGRVVVELPVPTDDDEGEPEPELE